MAIDTSMFGAAIPAATYAVGDRIDLGIIRGPAVVRDGYGEPKLKRMITLVTGTPTTAWEIHIKNSNWVDEVINTASFQSATSLSNNGSAIQAGQNVPLQVNSGWSVYAVCIGAGTEASALDLVALIDIDYPRVAAVADPKQVQGEPCSTRLNIAGTSTINGGIATPTWSTVNVDILKAGYKYLVTEMMFRATGVGSTFGFISISGAAGQGGLERIIPVVNNTVSLRYSVDYSTPLTKGPMNVNAMVFNTSATATTYQVCFDFVKKNV